MRPPSYEADNSGRPPFRYTSHLFHNTKHRHPCGPAKEPSHSRWSELNRRPYPASASNTSAGQTKSNSHCHYPDDSQQAVNYTTVLGYPASDDISGQVSATTQLSTHLHQTANLPRSSLEFRVFRVSGWGSIPTQLDKRRRGWKASFSHFGASSARGRTRGRLLVSSGSWSRSASSARGTAGHRPHVRYTLFTL